MKRILSLIGILLMGFTAMAQTTSSPAIDTISTTSSVDTANLVATAPYFTGNDGTFSVALVATKISGTVNALAILQSSIDGTNYINHYGTSADTFTLANASGAQVKHWYISGTKINKMRIRVLAPSSTQAVQVKGFYIKK